MGLGWGGGPMLASLLQPLCVSLDLISTDMHLLPNGRVLGSIYGYLRPAPPWGPTEDLRRFQASLGWLKHPNFRVASNNPPATLGPSLGDNESLGKGDTLPPYPALHWWH